MTETGGLGDGGRRTASGRGQTNVIGVVLLVGVVVVGTTAVLAIGGPAVDDARSHSAADRAEHAMTLFDSSVATVALGDSDVRSVSMSDEQGTYDVRPSAGRITVTHVNYDGGPDADGNGVDDGAGDDDHDLYTATLGAVVYRDGETSIAYQGGGVWRRDQGGNASMVSPPEFHYRGATLTLPVVRVDGDGGASGLTTARIKRVASGGPVFPAESSTYPGGDPYRNPTEKGRVVVTVESDYADAWGRYFETRTEGRITYPAPDTVTVTLLSLGETGDFPMPAEGDGILVRGLSGDHDLDTLEIRLRPDDTDSASFSNLQWSFYAEDGDDQLEIHLEQRSGHGCGTDVSVTVYFSRDGGMTYESWEEDSAFKSACADLDGDGDDEAYIDANFTSETVTLENTDYSGNLVHYNPSGATRNVSVTFDEHPGEELDEAPSDAPYTYADGERETIDTLLDHYLALVGEGFTLRVDDKNSNSVSESASYGTIDYPGGPEYITYLHVTENEVDVEFE